MKIVCIDLEMNHYYNAQGKCLDEVIQIGAVSCDAAFKNVREFNTFVTTNHKLRKVIRDLTGITPEDLVGQPNFVQAYNKFLNWVGDINDTVVYSWSKQDKVAFRSSCNRFKILNSNWIDHVWVDAQALISREISVDKKQLGLFKALEMLKLSVDGTHHNASTDAMAVYRLLEFRSQHYDEYSKYIADVSVLGKRRYRKYMGNLSKRNKALDLDAQSIESLHVLLDFYKEKLQRKESEEALLFSQLRQDNSQNKYNKLTNHISCIKDTREKISLIEYKINIKVKAKEYAEMCRQLSKQQKSKPKNDTSKPEPKSDNTLE